MGYHMNIYHENIIERIQSNYSQMTETEKIIADFFLKNQEKQDFSAKALGKILHISETSFSRFAKKIGFSGYREFLYMYEVNFHMPLSGKDNFGKHIFSSYRKLLDGFFEIVDEKQIVQFSSALSQANRIYLYALGSSACAALEFKLRFMRLGLLIELIDNSHLMQMQAVLVKPDDLVIGISLSGNTEEILISLKTAKSRDAKVLFITANRNKQLHALFDNILLLPSIEGLSAGDNISPQFPILIATDFIYSSFMDIDSNYKTALFKDTLTALNKEYS